MSRLFTCSPLAEGLGEPLEVRGFLCKVVACVDESVPILDGCAGYCGGAQAHKAGLKLFIKGWGISRHLNRPLGIVKTK